MKELHHICLTGILGTLSVSRNVEHLDDYFRYKHCIKCVRIGRYSGPFFPQFGLNAERCGVSLRIQSECGKVRTRKAPNMYTFHAITKVNLPPEHGTNLIFVPCAKATVTSKSKNNFILLFQNKIYPMDLLQGSL